jgi:hypothetical protein
MDGSAEGTVLKGLKKITETKGSQMPLFPILSQLIPVYKFSLCFLRSTVTLFSHLRLGFLSGYSFQDSRLNFTSYISLAFQSPNLIFLDLIALIISTEEFKLEAPIYANFKDSF